MKQKTPILPYLFSFISRITTFLCASVLMLFVLYMYGCIQSFMDTTQLFVLKLLALFSMFTTTAALVFIFFTFATLFVRQKTGTGRKKKLFLFTIVFVISAIMAFFSLSIITVSEGL